MLSEKEKLEEELRFLKESCDIGVITDEEYENGRQRIQVKIKYLEEKENEGDGLFKEEFQKTDDEKAIIYDVEENEKQQEKLDDTLSDDWEKERRKVRTESAFLRKKKELQQEEADEEIDREIDEIIGGRAGGGKEQEEKPAETEEDIFPLDSEDKEEIREKKEKRKEKKNPEYSEAEF